MTLYAQRDRVVVSAHARSASELCDVFQGFQDIRSIGTAIDHGATLPGEDGNTNLGQAV
jgi:hypothetical protein